MALKQIYLCPVCQGKGMVPNGFYMAIGVTEYGGSSTDPERCKTCDGRGIVILADYPEISGVKFEYDK